MKRFIIILYLLLLNVTIYSKSLIVSPGFGSGMVLQREAMVDLWGWGPKNNTVTIQVSWSKGMYIAKTGENGRWRVGLRTPEATFAPQKISIKSGMERVTIDDILIGDVWIVGGQSNMQMDFNGNPDQPVKNAQKLLLNCNRKGLRLFRVKNGYALTYADTMKIDGKWTHATPGNVRPFSVIGYIFGKDLYDLLNIPIGLVEIAHGGSTAEAWIDENALRNFGEFDLDLSSHKIDPIWYCTLPEVLFNKMLAPLLPYKVKGVVFYQGEANVERPEQYERLFPLLIKSWRSYFNDVNLPFFYTQIAPYNYEKGNAARLREAQLKILNEVPGCGMAVTMDVGEKSVIHPKEKEIVGDRLAFWALNKVYSMKAFRCRGPEYKSMEIREGHAYLKFNYAPNGLSFYGNEPSGFEIAGEDHVFYPAKARIAPAFWGNEGLEVWSEQVRHPVAVRYCYANWAQGNLYNTDGLPASSFRTDNW